jgi:hypothetical protein
LNYKQAEKLLQQKGQEAEATRGDLPNLHWRLKSLLLLLLATSNRFREHSNKEGDISYSDLSDDYIAKIRFERLELEIDAVVDGYDLSGKDFWIRVSDATPVDGVVRRFCAVLDGLGA